MRQTAEDIQELKERFAVQKKKLVIGVFVFVGIVMIIISFYIYHIKQETDAKNLQYEAHNALAQQRFSQAGDLFIKAFEKKRNISYLLNAGYAYYLAGDNKKALEYLNKAADMDDDKFSNLAKFKIAMIYLKENDKNHATKNLQKIIDGKSPILKDVALFELAKISNKEEAKKYYEEIINKFPSSPIVESAKRELQKLSN